MKPAEYHIQRYEKEMNSKIQDALSVIDEKFSSSLFPHHYFYLSELFDSIDIYRVNFLIQKLQEWGYHTDLMNDSNGKLKLNISLFKNGNGSLS